jgi:hypothetical protein
MNAKVAASIGFCIASLVLDLLSFPTFQYPLGECSYATFPGTLLCVLFAAASAGSFLLCPIRPLIAKAFILMAFIFQAEIAVEALLRYMAFGLHHS